MASRLRAHLPRVALFVLLGLAATATLTYAAGRQVGSTPPASTTAAPPPPLVVPDVRNQAFVFAKGSLEDSGFAWRVLGSVHGYAANTVATQSPAAATRVLDTGAPLITLTLKRNSAYPETGQAADASPYAGTVLQPAELASAAIGPEHKAGTTTAAPAAVTPKAATPVKTPKAAKPATPTKPAAKKKTSAWPQNRPVAFTVPGARTEPLDEMPLTNRAQLLRSWLEAHPTKTSANIAHWSYQNAWIVTGAKFGWWHGAEALTTLIAVDRRAQQLWGIGNKSALQAQAALSEVQSRSK